jgi:hypothetical protein
LVSSKLTLENFLNDTSGTINVNPDGLISLIYESEQLFSVQAQDRTHIPDQGNEEKEFFPVILPPNTTGDTLEGIIPPLFFDITFGLEDVNQGIDTLELTSGFYTATIKTDVLTDSAFVILTVENFIHQITHQPLIDTFNLSAEEGTDTLIISKTFNLAEYYVYFNNVSSDTIGTITLQADIGIFIPPDFGGYFDEQACMILINELEDIKYSQFLGYIGKQVESYSDTIDISIFNSADVGSITFGENCVKLGVELYNELGLPIKVESEKITAYHTTGTSQESVDIYFITNSGDTNNFIINSPTCNAGNGEATEMVLENSNIVEALEISPNKLFFKLNGILNPDQNPNETNCFKDTSDFTMAVKLQLDLFGNISEFKIADTIDFSIESVENLNALDLRIEFINGFPITASAQLDFLDDENNHLYSLFPQGEEIIILSAESGGEPDYKVIQPTQKETIVALDGEAMELVLKATKIIFTSTLSTEPGKLVKIYSDYSMDMALSAKFYVNY